jgi:hypothetical protein
MYLKYMNFQAISPACTELEIVVTDWIGKTLL